MSVHYKFKSNLDHDTVTFDGLSISVADLKKSIMHQKKIGKSSDFDLQITNAQTKEVYDNDETLVPKNTSVIVARVPVSSGNKKSWDRPDLPLPIGLDDDDMGQIRYDRIAKSADLVNAIATEEDKVKAMITQSSQEYDPSKYVKSRSMTGPLPPTYTCYRCGMHGHWIKDCPTNNPDVKRSTGIPRSFMVPVDGPEHRGALLTSSGEYAVPLIDHQAYKEVKKEKPPFVPQDEPVVEPEAQIPEELLCMLCRDLLQDAVLIPCCGNSFCDECVRQVLLESDNHECPLCHETEISPDTVIPNRFLRTAVLNFKNETGYTRVKRLIINNNSQLLEHVDSPQPSPDSTVETHSLPTSIASETIIETNPLSSTVESETVVETSEVTVETSEIIVETCDVEQSKDASEAPVPVIADAEESTSDKKESSNVQSPERTDILKDCLDTEIEDIQPGTPLTDEPSAEMSQPLPIQSVVQEPCPSDRHDDNSGSRYSRHRRGDYHFSEQRSPSPEEQAISTITTNSYYGHSFRKYVPRPAPTRQHFLNQRPHNVDRLDNYGSERDDYPRRYDNRRYNDRPSHRPPHHFRDYRSSRESRYHNTEPEHPPPEHIHHDPHYDSHLHTEDNVRRHTDRYASPPRPPIHVEALMPAPVYPPASAPPPVPIPGPPPLLVTQVYPMQPPPPGSSPIDTSQASAQPPPPGVGPLIPPLSSDPPTSYTIPFESEDPLKEPKKKDERSIDDRLEAFQRELEERDRKHTRERASRSRSRSVNRDRSRTSSRSFSSSKSWTRSPRSSTRTSRSHSRTPFSSRSRSRSYTRSRTRSWSKPRSYTRSRSRNRTESRSRSRSRNESRIRRKVGSRDRMRSPPPRSRSHSYSPKDYRAQSHRSYQGKRIFTPPRFGSQYQNQYGAPTNIVPLQVMRPPSYPPHHVHPIHPIAHPIHPHTVGHYQMDRPRYENYTDEYPPFEVYSHAQKPYAPQRYEREQRTVRYDKKQEYQRQEEVPHRIPGWVGDRSRENKSRYRPREQRKEIIKELPKVSDYEMKVMHAKEKREEPVVKKREEKTSSKHKKHHHKSKDGKKHERQENKIQVIVGIDKHSDMPQNLVKVETSDRTTAVNSPSSQPVKVEKVKERKHKHKKHKTGEQPTKKKKTTKKEKIEELLEAVMPSKIKSKKKKIKVKKVVEDSAPQNDHPVEEIMVQHDTPVEKEENISPVSKEPLLKEEKVVEEISRVKPLTQDQRITHSEEALAADTLDIFADDVDSETGLASEVVDEPDLEVAPADTSNELIEDVEEVNDITENTDKEDGPAEESEEDEKEKEDILHVDVPALSKWEREEYEEVFTSKPQRRSAVVIPKEGKGSLSSDIIQRAEKAILSKPLKTAIVNTSKEKVTVKNVSKEENNSTSPASPSKSSKDANDIKSVVNSERLPSPTLQVTISTVKEKRSVKSKKEVTSSKNQKDDSMQSKRVKLDRSSFTGSASESSSRPNAHRIVTVAESNYPKVEERQRHMDYSQRPNRREGKRYSSEREIVIPIEGLSRDKRESSRVIDKSRGNQYQSESSARHEKRRHQDSERGSRGDSRERRRVPHEHITQTRDKRPRENIESSKSYESYKKESYVKNVRSESYDSSDSYYSNRKVTHAKHPVSSLAKTESRDSDNKERVKKITSESSNPPRKHSPIKAPESRGTSTDQPKHRQSSVSSKHFHQDVLKFEPDYDEFSDVESRQSESKKKLKRTRDISESGKKRFKDDSSLDDYDGIKEKHKVENSSSSSSPSSSVASDSDSSDVENVKGNKSKSSDIDKQKHKKSKHKKHKKHKRKHKKKKSHKSSR